MKQKITPPSRDSERFLYHSFPRRFAESSLHDKKAHVILKNIVKYGLLLTPEVITWADQMHHSRELPDYSYLQLRACFTELQRSELADHQRIFGRYVIEWSIESARKLGCIPVFYMPTSAASPTTSMGNNAASLIHRLGEIHSVLGCFADIAEMKSTGPNDELSFHQEKIGCNLNDAQKLIASVFRRTLSPKELKNQLNAVMGYFYPCDSERYPGPLRYYEQREWRLVGRFQSRADPTTKIDRLPAKLKATLLRLDPDFFDHRFSSHEKEHRTVEECGLYKTVFGKHILEYASRIFCPVNQLSYVRKILADGKIELPVEALE